MPLCTGKLPKPKVILLQGVDHQVDQVVDGEDVRLTQEEPAGIF